MKLLIVDDHPIVRAGLRRLLASERGFDIVEAATGPEAIAAFREQQPDLVILDLNLPGLSGLEVLSRLRADNPKARVLVLSMLDNPLYVTRVLEAGAGGYVSKSAPPEQLLEAVRRVGAGQPYIEHEIAQELVLWNLRTTSEPLRQLSQRDVEILRLLAEGNSLTEIAGALGIGYKTVANHCSQLKAKLATPRMADLIRLAISSGLSAADAALTEPFPAETTKGRV
jgi:two-component system, NarL family, invasion response regulator UvrY